VNETLLNCGYKRLLKTEDCSRISNDLLPSKNHAGILLDSPNFNLQNTQIEKLHNCLQSSVASRNVRGAFWHGSFDIPRQLGRECV
jgi:hypothetical protein